MAVTIARVLTIAIGGYLAVGALFAVPFVLFGIHRIDPAVRGSTPGFRLIVLPGVVALWPLLARRWIAGTQPPEETNAHRVAARREPSS